MQTRKSNRKTISLPGRYFTGLGTPEDVTLADLSVGGCRFAYGDRKPVKGEEVGVTFTTPLSQKHFESFQASHIPDASARNAADNFDDMAGKQQQRFC